MSTIAQRIVNLLTEDDADIDALVHRAGIDIPHRWNFHPVYRNNTPCKQPEGGHALHFLGHENSSGVVAFSVMHSQPGSAALVHDIVAAVAEDGRLFESRRWQLASSPRRMWMDIRRFEEFQEACFDLVRDVLIPITQQRDFCYLPASALSLPLSALVNRFMLKGTPRHYVSDYKPPQV